MNKCKIVVLDEVNCVVHGLKEDHIHHFCNAYAIFAEGHFFIPSFTIGSWDGKIRYFYASGATFVFLLDEIIPTIVKLGYKVEIDDKRTTTGYFPKIIDDQIFNHYWLEDDEKFLTLFPHQTRVVNTLIENGGGVAVAATGAGKSFVCAAIAKQYNDLGARVLTIVPSQDLVMQTRQDFTDMKVECGEYSGDIKDHKDYKSVMSTWQALQNNPEIVQGFDVIIVDECHGIKGKVLQKLLNEYGCNIAHRFGVTGTLPKGKTDAMAVRITLGNEIVTVTAKELIDAGVLSSLQIHIEQLSEDLTDKHNEFCNEIMGKKPTYKQFKDAYFSDYTAEKSYLQRSQPRLDYIEEKLTTLKENGNTFVLVDGVAFGKKLAKEIPGAIFVHGSDKKKARKEIYDLFKTNDNLLVLATVNIASTGLNIKRIYNLVIVDLGKSFIRVVQSIGRGLRRAPDKDHVDVYDICSDFKYGKKHLTQRVKYYNEAEYPNTKQQIELKQFDDLDDFI